MKYKIGDKVRVRKDLKDGGKYGSQSVVEPMLRYLGKEATIISEGKDRISGENYFSINTDSEHWCWTPEMLEPAPLYKAGDKVLIKDLTEACEDDYSFGLTDEMKDLSNKICTIKSVDLDLDLKGDEEISYDGYEYKLKEDDEEYTWSSDMFVGSVIKASSNSTAISQDDPGPRGDLGTITTTAEAIAQAVDNVKGLQFKIGNKVVIRNDLIPGKKYEEWDYSPEDDLGGWEFAAAMAKYMGKVATITGYVSNDPNYCRLDIDGGLYSWIVNALLPYTPGSDYDLDKTIITNKQTKQNYENRLQESDPVISGGKERPGCAICYPGSKASIGIGHLRDSTTACKR